MKIAQKILEAARSGINRWGGEGTSRQLGALLQMPFDNVASVGAGAALTTIQGARIVPLLSHRVRNAGFSASAFTAVAAGTDPALDIYRHFAPPGALTASLVSPAAAGNVDNGAHVYAATYTNAAGETTPGPVVSVTVVDKTTNGKVKLIVPIGPTGTTGRKLYRGAAGSGTLLLLDTIADNTTVVYTDNIADSSLGAGAPTSDTTGTTILSATIKLSEAASNRKTFFAAGLLADASDPVEWPAGTYYTLRALTGASTGALTNLGAALGVELIGDAELD
jgi:hypothetical protein